MESSATGNVDDAETTLWDDKHREALGEAARTGTMPYAHDAIAAREDAFDRAVVRSIMAKLSSWMDSPACANHISMDPPDPLGPVGKRTPIAPTLWIQRNGTGSGFCASRLVDGSSWSVHRYEQQQPTDMSRVGQCGLAHPDSTCILCSGIDGDVCFRCHRWPVESDPPAATDPGSMDPRLWPIGVAWAWTHTEMEDRQVALLRSCLALSYDCVLHRTISQVGPGERNVVLHVSCIDPGRRLYIDKASWAFSIVDRLMGKTRVHSAINHFCAFLQAPDTNRAPKAVGDSSARGPLTAHDCTVGLAEARAALARLKYIALLCGSDDGDYHAAINKCVGILRGWIAAVDAVQSGGSFFLTTAAPFENALLDAVTHGLVGH